MADEKQTQRMKIKILEVKERQPIGDKGVVKLAFNATVDGKKAFQFFTFSPSLFEAIESSVGKEIEAEVIISEVDTKNGSHFVDRKVTQVYIDGKPVKTGSGGKGYNQGYSPEERASIEAQTGVKAVLGLVPHYDNVPSDISTRIKKSIEKALDWCDLKVDANMKPFVQSETPAPKPATKKAGAKAKTATDAIPTGEFKNPGEFLKACLDVYGLNRTKVLAELNATTLENIDLKAAWQTIKGPRGEKP